jgi:CheY-like chemotaxis protein
VLGGDLHLPRRVRGSGYSGISLEEPPPKIVSAPSRDTTTSIKKPFVSSINAAPTEPSSGSTVPAAASSMSSRSRHGSARERAAASSATRSWTAGKRTAGSSRRGATARAEVASSPVPCPSPRSPPSEIASEVSPESKRASSLGLLVVEDNVDSADSLTKFLELHGHRVEVAHDGPTALSRAKAAPPDAALIDIGLPAMSGHDVARRMREVPALTNVHLVALSGYARRGLGTGGSGRFRRLRCETVRLEDPTRPARHGGVRARREAEGSGALRYLCRSCALFSPRASGSPPHVAGRVSPNSGEAVRPPCGPGTCPSSTTRYS